jgi:hypothetical protein
MSIDQAVQDIKALLAQEHELGHINGLEIVKASTARRATIDTQWAAIQAELNPIQQQIKQLPALPPSEQIAWAQNVLDNSSLSFMEIDTTGTGEGSEIVRFTLSNQIGSVLADFFIKPQSAIMGEEARQANGIQDSELEHAPSLLEVWESIRKATRGRYIISFSQEWDIKQLNQAAQRYHLPPLVIVGECLQRRCTQYYHKEYYLSLMQVAERVGHPIANARAETRIKGQYHILEAIGNAITDVRPPKSPEPPASTDNTEDGDGLGSLDDHPF